MMCRRDGYGVGQKSDSVLNMTMIDMSHLYLQILPLSTMTELLEVLLH